jgi:hypothetical protein
MAPKKPKQPPTKTVQKPNDSAHWAAVIEALKSKTIAPRRPRGEGK